MLLIKKRGHLKDFMVEVAEKPQVLNKSVNGRKRSLENAVYNFRTVEGASNFNLISKLRVLEQRLRTDELFVGMAVRGSLGKGYSTQRSDLDVVVMFDAQPKAENTERVLDFIRKVQTETDSSMVDV